MNRCESFLSLADICEAATAGSRDLDWQIADAIGHSSFDRKLEAMWPPFMAGSKADKAVPHFSTSLDAAMTLVPEAAGRYGFDHWKQPTKGDADPRRFWAHVSIGGKYVCVRAHTKVLALLAAFLRAMAATEI